MFLTKERTKTTAMYFQKSNVKVASFTLGELLMVMLLTVLISGLCYTVLGYLQKKTMEFTGNIDAVLHLTTVEQQIQNDVYQYHSFWWNSNLQTLEMSNATGSIRYEFKEGKLYRNNLLLLDRVDQKTFFFRGKAIPSGAIDALLIETSDPLKFSLKLFFVQPQSAALYVPKSI